ncbi:hypothetical protein LEP1GSC016_2629 [Leptospira borgpetersenii serovar Hardjo-bovis str. Sponselee]|uniref:Uncharacterized protein n=1 Tax=Leptospira borgpetersenii serovar Hardjo-bovis str. Sponselee TaxID=1303729 RepID=M6BXB8_LEPBO|nr:hypothetical protein LEP1GSC016_2629 [Leptospira borgpetersenii serovar Hardjo-bovis str. Sponselee]
MIVPDTGKQFYRNVLFSFWQPVSKKLFACHFFLDPILNLA